MSLERFVYDIFLILDSIKSILDLYENPTKKGYVFERCCQLLIISRVLEPFSNDEYKHIIGNVNEGKIHYLSNIKNYFKTKKLISGNETGVSDITLYNETDDKYIFISSKYYSKEENVSSYGIEGIRSIILKNKHIYKNYDIYLLVNDKNAFMKKIKDSHESSNHITEDIKGIIDINDLESAFHKLKCYIKEGGDVFDNFNFQKKILIPKFHQKLFEKKIFKQIELGQNKFLLGLKPRSGKTFIVGLIISKDKTNYENFNILIITPAPKETLGQFLDMFNTYSGFNDFNIIHINAGNMIENLSFTNKNIIITSKQLLENYINIDCIESIKNLNVNYIFFDENHYGGTTNLSKDIIGSYKSDSTKLVFLTATFNKTLHEWNIPDDSSFYWDLEDEQLCKKNDIKSLIMKHGDEIIETFNYFNDPNILTSYEKMPDLELITTMFETSIFNNIKNELLKIDSNKYGFSLRTLLSISMPNKLFKYENEVELLLRYISGSKRHIDFPDEDKSIFGRIKEISTKKNSRTLLSNSNFTTQLWFLPFGIEQKINDVSQNLKKLMLNDAVLKHYQILILNSNTERPVKDIKDEIKKNELIGKDNGKSGLIILVGNQCSLGITIELCDITILLNDTFSSDKIYQMMYRCMTEAPGKKCGFVVDLNINRVLNTVMNYSLHKSKLNTEEKIKYIVEHNLINIDSDYFLNEQFDPNEIINNLLKLWKDDNPINIIQNLLKNLEIEIKLISEDQLLLNKNFTKSYDKNNNEYILFGVECQELPSGKTIKKDPDSVSDDSSSDISSTDEVEYNDKEEVKISLEKDIIPLIIPLAYILTIKENNKTFIEILFLIKHNQDLLDSFNEMTSIWWNKPDIIDLIIYLSEKYIKDNTDINNITLLIQMHIKSLIDKPIELLNYINECLKPKDAEKKKYGEVFTPIHLINDMLDKLPIEVWSNPNLKWFDPANGMGNFMIIIYYRLLEGLNDIFPDKTLCKKHIIENMLYMSEINKKNCSISKQIFDINNEYKLNIYTGDSLILDPLNEFGIEKFDIIVGNPPYNKDNIGTGNMIWHLFVKKSLEFFLNDSGYLVFIHPSLWRKPQSSKSKMKDFFKLMTHSNQMLYLEIHDSSDGMKIFNCGTRYDWYVINKMPIYKSTIIKDENGILNELNLEKYDWLPNSNFDIINLLIANSDEEKLEVINDFSYPRLNKAIVSTVKDDVFKYDLIYLTPKKGVRYMYSKFNNKGHFGIMKVIIGESGMDNAINDYEGNYGMTQDSFGIKISSKEEGEKILNVIKSTQFKNLIKKSCSWSNFRIDWRLFVNFKKNFYDFYDLSSQNEINEIDDIENNEINEINEITSISSKSTTTSSLNEKILCGAPLKKKGETCKNKGNPLFNGRCKKHST
jgi:hypothetical protein